MKKFTTALALALSFASLSYGQKKCDIAVKITSPANNTVIPYGDTARISFDITNNGPDVLPTGDTMFFAISETQIFPIVLTSDLQVNGSLSQTDFIRAWNPTQDALTTNLCIIHIRQSNIEYTDGTKAKVTYVDNDTTNDVSCVTVEFKAKEGNSSIATIENSAKNLNIYPNPAKNKIQFSTSELGNLDLSSVTITDISGRVVMNTKPQENSTGKYSVDVSQLMNGIYFLELNNEKGTQNIKGKFVISK